MISRARKVTRLDSLDIWPYTPLCDWLLSCSDFAVCSVSMAVDPFFFLSFPFSDPLLTNGPWRLRSLPEWKLIDSTGVRALGNVHRPPLVSRGPNSHQQFWTTFTVLLFVCQINFLPCNLSNVAFSLFSLCFYRYFPELQSESTWVGFAEHRSGVLLLIGRARTVAVSTVTLPAAESRADLTYPPLIDNTQHSLRHSLLTCQYGLQYNHRLSP